MLARAFSPAELADFKAKSAGKPWYWAPMTTLYYNGVHPEGTASMDLANNWTGIANVKMTRYEMAMVMLDVMGRSIPDRQACLDSAQAKLTDWGQIPERYRWPVAAAVGNGVINGTDGGRFAGSDRMTRAQACAVLIRLDSVVNAEPQPTPCF